MMALENVSPRAFGSDFSDLELDFDAGPRPHLTTRVITLCAAVDESSAWKMTVGRRIELLLTIAGMRMPGAFAINVRCSNPACRKMSEIELTMHEVLEHSAAAGGSPAAVELDGKTIRLRRPTGEDQLAWLHARPRDSREGTLLAVRSLIEDDASDWSAAKLEK